MLKSLYRFFLLLLFLCAFARAEHAPLDAQAVRDLAESFHSLHLGQKVATSKQECARHLHEGLGRGDLVERFTRVWMGHSVSADPSQKALILKLFAFLQGELQLSEAEFVGLREKLFVFAHEHLLGEREPNEALLDSYFGSFDPYSSFIRELSKDDGAKERRALNGSLGIRISKEDEKIVISELFSGAAAEQHLQAHGSALSIEVDDELLGFYEASGEYYEVSGLLVEDFVSHLKGVEGSEAKLRVRKSRTGKIIEVALKRSPAEDFENRARLSVHTRSDEHASTRVGVLNLPSFYYDPDRGVSASEDVKKILEEKAGTFDVLVLDLMANPGGYATEVSKFLAMFLDEEKHPLWAQLRPVQKNFAEPSFGLIENSGQRPLYDGPLVVAISNITQSAAELAAATLQHHGRALVIGSEHSFGKAAMISSFGQYVGDRKKLGVLRVVDNVAVPPSGRPLHGYGVQSDVVIHELVHPSGSRYLTEREHLNFMPIEIGTPSFASKDSDRFQVLDDVVLEELREHSSLREDESLGLLEKVLIVAHALKARLSRLP